MFTKLMQEEKEEKVQGVGSAEPDPADAGEPVEPVTLNEKSDEELPS